MAIQVAIRLLAQHHFSYTSLPSVALHVVESTLSCGFDIFRERVARKVHTRHSHRRRYVAVCENGHKTRVGFPS